MQIPVSRAFRIRSLRPATFALLVLMIAIPATALGAGPHGCRFKGRTVAGIGQNLDFQSPWSGEIKIVDAMVRSMWQTRDYRPKGDHADDARWDYKLPIPMRADGYPTHVPFRIRGRRLLVQATLFSGLDGHFPSGDYTLKFKGTGRLKVFYKIYDSPGTYPVQVQDRMFGESGFKQWGIPVMILESAREDPIRDIQLILPGHASTHASRPINPAFIKDLRDSGTRVVRTQNLTKINDGEYPCDNGRKTADPACKVDRIHPINYGEQAGAKGLSPHWLPKIANEAGVDLWINVHHAATDRYVRELARILFKDLARDRRVYVELSNEAWNPAPEFPQSKYFAAMGRRAGLGRGRSAGEKFYVKRSLEIFGIFRQVFGKQNARLITIIAGQTGDFENVSRRRLEYVRDPALNPRGTKPRALAMSAYLSPGGRIGPDHAGTRASQILSRAEDYLKNSLGEEIKKHARLARRHGLRLLAYEGGQHFVMQNARDWSYTEPDEAPGLEREIRKAIAHKRMNGLYRALMERFFAEGGDLFMHYTSIHYPNRFSSGNWGLLEYTGQSRRDKHRFRALRDFQKKALGCR